MMFLHIDKCLKIVIMVALVWSSTLQTSFCVSFFRSFILLCGIKYTVWQNQSDSGCTCFLHEGLIILPYTLLIRATAVSVWEEETSWNPIIHIICDVGRGLPWLRSFCHAKLKCLGSGFRCVGLIYWKTHIGKVVRPFRLMMSCFQSRMSALTLIPLLKGSCCFVVCCNIQVGYMYCFLCLGLNQLAPKNFASCT